MLRWDHTYQIPLGKEGVGTQFTAFTAEKRGFLFKESLKVFKNSTSWLFHASYRSQKLLAKATSAQASGNPLEISHFQFLCTRPSPQSWTKASPFASVWTHFKLWTGRLNGLKGCKLSHVNTWIVRSVVIMCGWYIPHGQMHCEDGVDFPALPLDPLAPSCYQNHYIICLCREGCWFLEVFKMYLGVANIQDSVVKQYKTSRIDENTLLNMIYSFHASWRNSEQQTCLWRSVEMNSTCVCQWPELRLYMWCVIITKHIAWL